MLEYIQHQKEAERLRRNIMDNTEKRGLSLINHIRKCMPGCGHLHINPKSSGRKAFFMFRSKDYEVSSRLNVKQCCWGKGNSSRVEDEDTIELTARFKGATL